MEVTPSRPKRVLQNLTPHDLNSLDRKRTSTSEFKRSHSTRKQEDSRELIKTLSSRKKTGAVINSHRQDIHTIRKVDACRYIIQFPPGPMGLHLEPVITSHNPDRRIGCRVKAFHFDTNYCGIDKNVLQSSISVGDVLYSVDGVDVYLSPFDDVFQLLRGRINERKAVGFRIISLETMTSTDRLKSFPLNVSSPASNKSPKTPIATSPALTEVHPSTPSPTPRSAPVLSAERKGESSSTSISGRSPASLRTPSNLSFLAAVDDLSLLHIDTLRSLFPVRFEELSHTLNAVGANIGSSILDAGLTLEDRAEKALGRTVQHLPIYSREDMLHEQDKVKLLLQELSETCMRLGASDSQFIEAERELAEVKVSEAREREKSAKLQSALATVTGRLDDLGMELGAERADRDAWAARASAAEEENQFCRGEFEALQKQCEELEEEYLQYRQRTEMQDREEGEFEQQLEDVRRQYDSLRSEMESIVCKVRAEKVEIERERDIALAELEVMRDLSGSERKSIDKEKSRIKEALNTQQALHMQRILESEEECYQLKTECSELKVKLDKASSQCAQVQSAKLTLETKLKASEEKENESRRRIDHLEAELTKIRGELESVSAENRARKNECSSLRDSRTDLEGKLETARRSLQNMKQASESQEQQLDKLQHDLMEARRENIRKESDITEAKDLIADLRQDLDAANKHSSDQLARLRSRSEAREAELLGAVLVAEKRVAQVEKEAEQRISKHLVSAESAQTKIVSLSSELSTLTAKLQQGVMDLNETEIKRSTLETSCCHLRNMLEEEQVRNKSLESVRANYDTDIENLRLELLKARLAENEMKSNVDHMRQLAFDANAEINTKCIEIDKLKASRWHSLIFCC